MTQEQLEHTGMVNENAAQLPAERWIDVRPDEGGLRLHIREWPGALRSFVLLHGLASNASTWDAVATRLAAHGHHVVAVDQRGHGLSDKPDDGYEFSEMVGDLARLLKSLELDAPVIAGQSWGGNVVLAFAAAYPGVAHRLVLVDGGFIDLQMRPEASWERVASELRPPDLAGLPRSLLKERIRAAHPDWSDDGVEATLANFEILADGTVRPWLTLPRHMSILRAMWDQRPTTLYPLVTTPVTIVVAEDPGNPAWMEIKHSQVHAAAAALPKASVHWFPSTAHDIHVHRPAELATLMLNHGLEQEG